MATANLQIIITALDRASGTLNKVGKNLAKTGAKMKSVGKTMTMGLTLPLVAMGAGAIKASIDLENAFIGVRKTVDATEEELQKLKKGFDDMAKRIPIATTELYGIGEAAGQLGIRTENIIHFTETMAQLGVTTNLSAQEAATALARFANIVQMPQENFDRLGATIVDLGNNLATTEAEIVAMGLRLSGAGKQVGMTEAQMMSLGAALSSVGIRAEAGGTAFSKMMLEMNNAVMSGSEKMEGFAKVAGMTAAQFQKAFKEDAALAIVSFIEGLGKMSDAGENLVPIMEELELNDIRMRDALLRASGAGDLFSESLKIGSAAWEENIALTEEAEKKFASTGSQLRLLTNNLQQMAAQFGDILAPMLLGFINKYLKPLMKHFKEMSPATKKIVIVVGGLVAALGPLLMMFGMIIPALPVVAAAFSPIGLAVAGIIIVVAELIAIGWMLYKDWDLIVEGFRLMIMEKFTAIKNFFLSIWEKIKGIFEAAIKPLILWGEAVKEVFTTIGDFLRGVLIVWKELLRPIWQPIVEASERLSNFLADWLGRISDLVYEKWTAVGNILKGVWNAISNAFTAFLNPLKDAWENTWNWVVEKIQWVLDKITAIVAKIKGAVAPVTGLVKGIGEKISGVGEKIGAGIKGFGQSVWGGIKQITRIGGGEPFSFQHGGIATSPMLARVAETEPEAIIPLSKLGVIGGTINIYIQGGNYLDRLAGEKFAEVLGKMLRKQLRYQKGY